jgi:hypothetical protein
MVSYLERCSHYIKHLLSSELWIQINLVKQINPQKSNGGAFCLLFWVLCPNQNLRCYVTNKEPIFSVLAKLGH